MKTRSSWLGFAFGLFALVAIMWFVNRTPTTSQQSRTSAQPTATLDRSRTAQPKPTKPPVRAQTDEFGIAYISLDELPPEALDTLDLIERGGPFPYSKDGATFGNRERLLPRKASGYYQEYTVETPGENDRGARRIVAGDGGELYYTDDHYASFRRIQQ